MSDSGLYGPTRVAAGIVGFADLTLGDRVEPVLEAHLRAGGGRFRGVRHSAAWDASDVIGNTSPPSGPGLMARAEFREGLARLTALGLSLDAWVFHPQLADVVDLARACPDATSSWATGRPARLRPLRGQARRGVRDLEGRDHRAGAVRERHDEARRHDDAARRLRLRHRPAPPSSAELAAPGARTSRRASSCSAPTAACSRATSPSTRWASAGPRSGTRFKRIAAGASADEKRALFSGTARRVYRLEE